MKRTSIRVLAAVMFAVGLVSHMVLNFVDQRYSLPVPVSAVTTLLLAILTFVLWRLGVGVKKFVAQEETTMDAIGAARVAVLAKTCSLGGSGLLGYFLAQLVIGLSHRDSPLYAKYAAISVATVLVCVALIGVALLVESWCAVPPDDDDRGGSGVRGASTA